MSDNVLTPTEVAEYRIELPTLFPDTATITKITYVSDGVGGSNKQTTTISNVPAMVGALGSGNEYEIAARLSVQSPHIIVLPYGTSLNEKDTVTINGTKYEIQVILTGFSYSMAVYAIASKSGG